MVDFTVPHSTEDDTWGMSARAGFADAYTKCDSPSREGLFMTARLLPRVGVFFFLQ